MRSPMPIEPMHSFSYGHLRQRLMARGRVRTYDDDDENVAQHGAHTGQLMHLLTSKQFDNRDPFYDILTAVKSRYPLTGTL